MAFHPCTDVGFEGWAQGMEDAGVNTEWDMYDSHIQHLILRYNDHLRDMGDFIPIDWRLIKAMIWTETGAKNRQWKTLPMQIGIRTDPGMHDLLTDPNRRLVVLPDLWSHFTKSQIRTNPYINIEAGISLLLMRMAHFRSTPNFHSFANAHFRSGIVSWRSFTPQTIFMRYNQGDGCYARKLIYCMRLIHSIKTDGRQKKAS